MNIKLTIFHVAYNVNFTQDPDLEPAYCYIEND
jgi:hypothetical protein